MARRLIGRKKLDEALGLLNETIRQNPRFAESFENRAEVFDLMGMYPQAQADRRKAADLRAAYPPAPPAPPRDLESATFAEPHQQKEVSSASENAPVEESSVAAVTPGNAEAEEYEDEEPQPAAAGSGEPPSPPPVVPAYRQPKKPSFAGAFLRAAAVVLFALGVFVIAGVGLYVALQELQGDDDDGGSVAASETPAPSGSPSDTGDGTATAGPTDIPLTIEEALEGDPYSFSNMEAAWAGRDITASIDMVSESVTGFSRPAIDVTLTREGATMEVSVIVYESREDINADWTLTAAPAPKVDAQLPAASSVWYNVNTVVIVRVSHDALRNDARDGYFDTMG